MYIFFWHENFLWTRIFFIVAHFDSNRAINAFPEATLAKEIKHIFFVVFETRRLIAGIVNFECCRTISNDTTIIHEPCIDAKLERFVSRSMFVMDPVKREKKHINKNYLCDYQSRGAKIFDIIKIRFEHIDVLLDFFLNKRPFIFVLMKIYS